MAKVVKRNSTIPVLQEKEFTTCADNQQVVSQGLNELGIGSLGVRVGSLPRPASARPHSAAAQPLAPGSLQALPAHTLPSCTALLYRPFCTALLYGLALPRCCTALLHRPAVPQVKITVFEGERAKVEDNSPLGTFDLTGGRLLCPLCALRPLRLPAVPVAGPAVVYAATPATPARLPSAHRWLGCQPAMCVHVPARPCLTARPTVLPRRHPACPPWHS
jgi:hypothetical protein